MFEVSKIIKENKFILFLALLTFCFCLYGINWGHVQSWNPDQMALRRLFLPGKLPLNPSSFFKPPFYPYFIYFLDVLPISHLSKVLNLSVYTTASITLIWAQVLTVSLLLISIIIVYRIIDNLFGTFSAQVISVIFATSASFQAHTHYLTTDIPVMCAMLIGFYFAHKILFEQKLKYYLWAGFFTGLATATKYNGLAIGIALFVAHALSLNKFPSKDLLFSKKLTLGLIMVVLGFIVCNPFSILDYDRFIIDFAYNYIVTPVYGGQSGGNSFLPFLATLPNLIGWPSLTLLIIAIPASLIISLKRGKLPLEKKAIVLLLCVFILYFYKFGSEPRIVPRFVLPIVPYLLMMQAPLLQRLQSRRIILYIVLTPLIAYNLICCFYVGKRFVEDPRMQVVGWMRENLKKDHSLEVSGYLPDFKRIDVGLKAQNMPFVGGRKRVFAEEFKNNKWMQDKIPDVESEDELNFYTLENLMIRQPDYIILNSESYGRFVRGGRGAKHYPELKKYFDDLLKEKTPYKIIFDRTTNTYPKWIYPQTLDFLDTRTTILELTRN